MAGQSCHLTHDSIYRHKPDEDPPPQTEKEKAAIKAEIAKWWSTPGIIPGIR